MTNQCNAYFFMRCGGAVTKIIFLLAVVQVSALAVGGQTSHTRRKENFDVHEFHDKQIHLIKPAEQLSMTGFSGISVIDARADTSHIGFMQRRIKIPFLEANVSPLYGENERIYEGKEQIKTTRPTIVRLGNGTKKEIELFLHDYLQLSANDSLPQLLMVIKKLWLSDELEMAGKVGNNDRVQRAELRTDQWTSGIDVNIEWYIREKEVYFPLYRFDSIITKKLTVSEYAPQFLSLAIASSLQRMPQMLTRLEAIRHKRNFNIDEINERNCGAFNLPVLKDSVLKKGVYSSFTEFKNNSPSHEAYSIRKEKLADILYIQGVGGNEYVARDVWGYCDGTNAFIKSVDNFFLLQQLDKAFYIFGAKNVIRSTDSGVLYGTDYYTVKTSLELKPFQLDWTTGKLY